MLVKKTILAFFLLVMVMPLFAQEDVFFEVSGRLTTDDGSTNGAIITLVTNGNLSEVITLPRTGRFSFDFDYNNEYELTFQCDGYFKKIVVISTHVPQDVMDENSKFPAFQFVVNLFNDIPGIDESFTNKAVAKISYNSQIDNFDSEIYYSDIDLEKQIEEAVSQNLELDAEQRDINRVNEQELAAKEKEYDKLIADADAFYQKQDFESALVQYEAANALFPDRPYPNDRIAELQDLIAAMQLAAEQNAEIERNYQIAVAEADNLFNQGLFSEAAVAYQKALGFKANDSYAVNRLAESKQMFEQREIDIEYDGIIAQADAAYLSQNYDRAIELYEKAIALKPDGAQYADDQLKKINQEIEDQAQVARDQEEEINQRYTRAIEEGDRLFEASDFEVAKIEYETALSIKPNEEYPRNQIAAIEGEFARIARLEQAYYETIEQANVLVEDNSYQEARDKYEEALQYKLDEEYPKLQILRIDEILAQIQEEEERNASYEASITKADELLGQEEYATAREEYQLASDIKPEEQYPLTKIREIDSILAEMLRQQQELEQTQREYDDAIARADNSFAEKNYEIARMTYREAQIIKPEETYPQAQLDEIDRLEALEIEQAYQEAITKADGLYSQEDYAESKIAYQDALGVKSNDSYARSQINLIDEALAQLAAQEEARQMLENNYQTKLALAESAFNNELYPNAKEYYQQALEVKPEEQYPADQIAKIDNILLELQRQAEIDAQYDEIMTQANDAYGLNNLEDAIELYRSALAVKPNELLPAQRIADIENMIARKEELALLAAQEEAQRIEVENAIRERYDAAIASAEAELSIEHFANAKGYFVDALNILPDEQYPKDKIDEIDRLIEERALADMALKQKAYQDSLSKAQTEAYNLKIERAQQFENNGELEQAISVYREAIAILPANEVEVTEKINQLQNQIRILDQQDDNYERAIMLADQLYAQGNWESALTSYEDALNYNPDEEYPKERIRYLQSLIKDREDSYDAAITAADNFYDLEDWLNAKDKYTEAINIKKDEQYPSSQLILVNRKIREEQEGLLVSQELEKSYQDAIAKGDEFFAGDQLTASKTQFEFALSIKPGEEYPISKIAEIDLLLALREEQQAIAKQQSDIDDRYRQAISLADSSFKKESYTTAKEQYQQALLIKPEEEYPRNQIEIINEYLNSANVPITLVEVEENVSYNPTSNAASYTPTQSSFSGGSGTLSLSSSSMGGTSPDYTISTDYNTVIRLADNSYAIQDYTVAQFYYYKASEIDPDNAYPKQRIEEIGKLIDLMLSSDELAAYNEAIRRADTEFARTNYSIARFYYYKALEVKSWEQYPKDRIEEIRALTQSMLSQREEAEYRALIASADGAYYSKDYSVARSYYKKALTIRTDEQYPSIKIIDINKAIASDLKSKQTEEYRQLINQADMALLSKQYAIARSYYNQALNIKPEENYPKEQIKKIRDAILNRD